MNFFFLGPFVWSVTLSSILHCSHWMASRSCVSHSIYELDVVDNAGLVDIFLC